MSEVSMIPRVSIVLCLVAMVVTILYLTPLPNQNFKDCDRPCHDLDWPMICRIELQVESFHMNILSKNCEKNSSNCGLYEGAGEVITLNRKLPGPHIKVCHKDIVIVDIINNVPGQNLAVHWRGQTKQEAPFMDGVPMVTQCPISGYTTFQYKFRASTPGTHFYHAFSNEDRANGLFGALLVNQAQKLDHNRKHFDLDEDEHTILLSEWSKNQPTILVNGRAPHNPTTFHVKNGKRYKFRLIFASARSNCPITVSINGHLLRVIAVDGHPIHSHEVTSLVMAKGERLDFILKASRAAGSYNLTANMTCETQGATMAGLAVIRYEGNETETVQFSNEGLALTFDTSLCEWDGRSGRICLEDVRSLDKIQTGLEEADVAEKLYLGFDYASQRVDINNDTSFVNRYYRMNNISFVFPSSPLLTQLGDTPLELICSEEEKAICDGKEFCHCIHVEHIPLGSSVELILHDLGAGHPESVFHLHGHNFYVVGGRSFPQPLTREEIQRLDLKSGLVKRNLLNPVIKDTIRVPRNGVVVIRFMALNPGFWMLRDEHSETWTRGMDILFQVGDPGDLVALPSDFPTCGNFIGPHFFLF